MSELTLLVLRCRDLEQSRKFYAALSLILTTEKHGSGPVHYSCQLGTTVLELYPATSTPSSIRLGITVPNVLGAMAALRSLGGRIDREPTAEDPSGIIRDPDDKPVELSQARDRAAQQAVEAGGRASS